MNIGIIWALRIFKFVIRVLKCIQWQLWWELQHSIAFPCCCLQLFVLHLCLRLQQEEVPRPYTSVFYPMLLREASWAPCPLLWTEIAGAKASSSRCEPSSCREPEGNVILNQGCFSGFFFQNLFVWLFKQWLTGAGIQGLDGCLVQKAPGVALSEMSPLSPPSLELFPSQAACSSATIDRGWTRWKTAWPFAATGYLANYKAWIYQQKRLASGCSCTGDTSVLYFLV